MATAANHRVYVANGAGSGTWKQIDTSDLAGSIGDAGSNNKYLRTNGVNGLEAKTDKAYGSATITNNTNAFAMGAAVDPNLATNSDYVLFTGTGAPWAGESLFGGMTFATDHLIVPVTGVYFINLWMNISQFPTNTAKVGAKYRVNGTTFGTRNVITKSNSAGDFGQLNGFGLTTQLTAGDLIQIYLASSAAGGLIVANANSTLMLVREA